MPGIGLTSASPPASALNRLLLPGVRQAHERDADRPPRHRAVVELALERGELVDGRIEPRERFRLADELDVLVGEVERGFQVGEQVQQVVAERVRAVA